MARLQAAIIGTGPAGLEAALNLKIRRKSFVLFGSAGLSAKIRTAPKINNYLGLPGISGEELAARLHKHLREMDISITPEQVTAVYPMGDYFSIATNRGLYEADTVILATGVQQGKPISGELEFLGRGVGYCATCDAPLYQGKTVLVAGYGEDAVEEANFISEIVGTLYYLPGPGMPPPAKLAGSVKLLEGKLLEIRGGSTVQSVLLTTGEIPVDGVFLLRDVIAPSTLLPGLGVTGGYIDVDSRMATNLPGCFAAGDCTGKPHQYMRAAGQGLIAAHSAVAYIDNFAN